MDRNAIPDDGLDPQLEVSIGHGKSYRNRYEPTIDVWRDQFMIILGYQHGSASGGLVLRDRDTYSPVYQMME